MRIFDTHAHYDDERFDADRSELLASLPKAGVVGVVNCATDYESSVAALELTRKYPYFYAACGVHPHEAESFGDDSIEKIAPLLRDEKCVAIGEIGLDYHYDFAPREKQLYVFEQFLSLAADASMPVVVHDREAHLDTMTLLKKYRPRGVLHCFTGSAQTALEAVDLGLYLGFGGSLTFKNAKKPVEAARVVPLERIVLETDCPYMSPVPVRGTRNDSANIKYVAERLALIKGVDADYVCEKTYENALKLFNL